MQKKALLIINSSHVFMNITKKILERADYSVHCAVGVRGAEELIGDFIPDGIILENDLPDGSGLDYCKELRKNNSIPILFLSSDHEDELPALLAGASDFLKKPFDYDILTARLSVMLGVKPTTLLTSDDFEDGDTEDESGRSPVDVATTDENERAPAEAEPAADRKKQRKRPFAGSLVMMVAACLALAVFGLFALLSSRQPGTVDISDFTPPLAGLPLLLEIDADARPYTGEFSGMFLPVAESAVLRAGDSEVSLLLLNPEGNSCYFVFVLSLPDAEEALFSSGLVEPGMCLRSVSLERAPEQGEHTLVLLINSYSLDERALIGSVKMGVSLTVE